MNLVIAGASGFLGRPLVASLVADGHRVAVLSRSARAIDGARTAPWAPDGRAGDWARLLDDCDAVINLAGEGIGDKRWSPAQKAQLRSSRVLATRSLVTASLSAARPPRVFVNGSAVGYYGDRGDEILTERSTPGRAFLSQICIEWEAEATPVTNAGVRTALIRTGLVLGHGGGALAKMSLPFKLGVGGRLGSGRQWWPWIHLDDWVAMVRWTLLTEQASGAINATGPAPATNADFTRALGRAVHRPTLVPAPAFALRLAMGEMADELVLSSQRAVPTAALERGFTFKYSALDAALRASV